MCHQQSLRSACAYAQSVQSLCLSLEYPMSVKLLTGSRKLTTRLITSINTICYTITFIHQWYTDNVTTLE